MAGKKAPILLCILAWLTFTGYNPVLAHSQDQEAIFAVTEQFIKFYEKKDLNGLMSLWDPSAANAPAFQWQMEHLFGKEEYMFGSLKAGLIVSYGEQKQPRASVRFVIPLTIYDINSLNTPILDPSPAHNISGVDDHSPQPVVIERRERRREILMRTLEFEKSDVWKITYYGSPKDALVASLAGPPQSRELAIVNECTIARDPGMRVSTRALIKALMALSDAQVNEGKYDKARTTVGAARRIAIAAKLVGNVAHADWCLGLIASKTGRNQDAIEHYRRALGGFRSVGWDDWSALTLFNLGSLRAAQKRYLNALQFLQAARSVADRSHSKELSLKQTRAAADAYIGTIYLRLKPRSALDPSRRAVQQYKYLHNPTQYVNAQVRLAHAFLSTGDFRSALPLYSSARRQFKEGGNRSEEGKCLLGVGTSLFAQGDFEAALNSLEAARDLIPESDLKGRGNAQLALSASYQALAVRHGRDVSPEKERRYRAFAHASAQKSLALFLRTRDVSGAIAAYVHLENAELASSRLLAGYRNSIMRLDQKGKPGPAISVSTTDYATDYHLASNIRLLWVNSSSVSAAKLQKESVSFFSWVLGVSKQQEHSAAVAVARLNLAIALLRNDRNQDAAYYARTAASVARDAGSIDVQWRAMAVESQAQSALGRLPNAAARLEEAVQQVEVLRGRIVTAESRGQRYLEDKTQLYEHLVDILVRQGDWQAALQYSERIKGRLLLSALRNVRDAQDYQTNALRYYGARKEQMLSMRQARELLSDSRVALVEYCVTDQKTFVFVLTRSQSDNRSAPAAITAFSLPLSRSALQKRALALNDYVSRDNGAFEKSSLPRDLFEALLGRAVQGPLRGKRSVVIVPDGPLWLIPFQALVTSAPKVTPRYLVEDYAVSHAYSLTWLWEQQKRWKGHPRAPLKFLAFGNPLSNRTPSTRTSGHSLPVSGSSKNTRSSGALKRGVRTFVSLYGSPQSVGFEGKQATRTRFLDQAWRGRILYLPVHGVLDDQHPMNSYVKLAPEDSPSGYVHAYDISRLHLNAELMILAACQTARGYAAPGEGLVGMTWACSRAGVRTTIGTQWEVPIPQTEAIMKEYHRIISRECSGNRRGVTKVEALREAALSLINKGGPEKRLSPYYWAGMVLIGDSGSLNTPTGPIAVAPHLPPWSPRVAKGSDSGINLSSNMEVQLFGGKPFGPQATANPGDVVSFKILLVNTGYRAGIKPLIQAHLDPRLTYEPGSSSLLTKQRNENVQIAIQDRIIKIRPGEITWQFTDMSPRATSAIYLLFKARVSAATRFPKNSSTGPLKMTVLTNYAVSSFEGKYIMTNYANVMVANDGAKRQSYSVRMEVTNEDLLDPKTKSPAGWQDEQSAPASPGDLLRFRLTVVNTGNVPGKDIRLKAFLTPYVQFAGDVRLYNNRYRDVGGQKVPGADIVKEGIMLRDLPVGTNNMQVIIFEARVIREIPYSAFEIRPTAELQYRLEKPFVSLPRNGPIKERVVTDRTWIIVDEKRGLHVLSSIQDPATGRWERNLPAPVREGDVMQYRVILQNNSKKVIRNVVVRAHLPYFATVIYRSLAIDGEVSPPDVQRGFLSSGICVTDMAPGFSQAITFQVRINDNPVVSEPLLRGGVKVLADHVSPIQHGAIAHMIRH